MSVANNAPPAALIVGYAANETTYHTRPNCGNGKNMPAFANVGNRTLCLKCPPAVANNAPPAAAVANNAYNSDESDE